MSACACACVRACGRAGERVRASQLYECVRVCVRACERASECALLHVCACDDGKPSISSPACPCAHTMGGFGEFGWGRDGVFTANTLYDGDAERDRATLATAWPRQSNTLQKGIRRCCSRRRHERQGVLVTGTVPYRSRPRRAASYVSKPCACGKRARLAT